MTQEKGVKKKNSPFVIYKPVRATLGKDSIFSHTVTVNRYSFNTTDRASCKRKMLATMRNHLSPADLIWARRLRATKVADMNPATPAITHLKISKGTTERHCTKKRSSFSHLL